MSDINVGAISEALNDKADRDLHNVDTIVGADAVVEFQLPTSQNDYTWYRKYASGWVEQGGTTHATTRGEQTPAQVNLAITMSDGNYYVNCQKVASNDGASVAIQVVDRDSAYFNWCVTYGNSALERKIVWEVKGMSAAS